MPEALFRGLLPWVRVVEACDLSLLGASVDIQVIPGTIHKKREALERMTSKLEVLNPHQAFVLLKNAFPIPTTVLTMMNFPWNQSLYLPPFPSPSKAKVVIPKRQRTSEQTIPKNNPGRTSHAPTKSKYSALRKTMKKSEQNSGLIDYRRVWKRLNFYLKVHVTGDLEKFIFNEANRQ